MPNCKCCGKPVINGVVIHSECFSKLIERAPKAPTPNFEEGEYIIYQNGDSFEIGKIKRIVNDGAFIWYHDGETAAKTPFDCMHKLRNAYTILNTSLGGGGNSEV